MFARQGVLNIKTYSMMVGLILAVLVGLNGTKIITDKVRHIRSELNKMPNKF